MVPSPLSALWLSLDEKKKFFSWSGIRQTNLRVHSELQSATRKHIARKKGQNKTIVFFASLGIFLPLLLPFFFFFSLGSTTSVASFFLRDAGEILPFFPAGKTQLDTRENNRYTLYCIVAEGNCVWEEEGEEAVQNLRVWGLDGCGILCFV